MYLCVIMCVYLCVATNRARTYHPPPAHAVRLAQDAALRASSKKNQGGKPALRLTFRAAVRRVIAMNKMNLPICVENAFEHLQLQARIRPLSSVIKNKQMK